MSSMRNAVQRRNHKERAQPHAREKWGILEKHKDYTLRARDFNEKKKRLRILRQKAADRNEDEFSFKMMSTKMVKGQKLGDRGNTGMTHDTVSVLKTQDAGYLRTMMQRNRKEMERLEEEVRLSEGEEGGAVRVMKGSSKKAQHLVFVDNVDQQRSFDAQEWFGTDGDGLKVAYNRPRRPSGNGVKDDSNEIPTPKAVQKSRKAVLAAELAAQEAKRAEEKRRRAQDKRVTLLDSLRTRGRELAAAELKLDLQRARMSNSIGGVNKNGVKFKIRERKR